MSLEIVLDDTAYEPGAEIRGRVEWPPEARPEKVLVSLLWYTESKGNEDVKIVDQTEAGEPSRHRQHNFSLRLPDFPWSFNGTLISLTWAVEASLEASLEPGGAVERVTIVVAPGGEAVRL